MSKLEEKIQVVNQTHALLLSELSITDPDFFDLIKDLNKAGFNLNTVKDILNVNGGGALTRLAINKVKSLLTDYLVQNQSKLDLNIDLDSAYNGLVNQIKQKFSNDNSDEVLTKGKLLLVFIPESDLQDKSQILIDEIRTFLSPLNEEEYDIACSSWGYGKLAESIDQISKRYPNLTERDITRIKRDLESRLYSSLTEQSQNFLSTVRQDMIQDLTQNPKLNNLSECFTEHPANASEIQVTKFYEFVDLFSSKKLANKITGVRGGEKPPKPIPKMIEELLEIQDRRLTKEEIAQELNVDIKKINFNDAVYTCEINNGFISSRHINFLQADIENEGLNFNDTVRDIMEKLQNYFNDNPQVKKFTQDGNQYKTLHLQEYFSKTINQSLSKENDYYGLPNSVDYYALLNLAKRFIGNGLYYRGDVKNITNHPKLNQTGENITVPRLLIRVLNASIFPITIDEIAARMKITTAYIKTKLTDPEVIPVLIEKGNDIYTTIKAEEKYSRIVELVNRLIVRDQTTLQQFTTQANQNLGCDYRIEFYRDFLVKENGYNIVDGLIS